MKKFTLFIAALFFVGAANAQDMTSKRGINILPEAGDISISMSANPFLTYAGQAAGGNASAMSMVQFLTNDQYIAGRYFLSETAAIRGYVRIGFGSTSTDVIVDNLGTNADESQTLTNKTNSNDIWIGGGYEIRRGNYGRFQGYYGGELLFGISGSGSETNTITNTTEKYVQTVDVTNGSRLTLGVQGFIGVEYFFAPKVALGGEFHWGLAFSSTGEGETKTSNTDPNIDEVTVKTGGSSSFGLDTGNWITSGNLKLSFFF